MDGHLAMVDPATQKFADTLTKQLPALKPGLDVVDGPRSHFGAPTAIVYDPASNEHYRFDWKAATMLRHWQPGITVMELCHTLSAETAAHINPETVGAFIDVLQEHDLVERVQETYDPVKHNLKSDFSILGLLKRYFYWRVPLVNPDKTLDRMMPFVRPLLHKYTAYLLILLGLVGFWLVGNQWDNYWATLPYIFTTSGMIVAFVSLAILKAMHELGHGLITKFYDRPVTTMGVAFLFLFPILYTDTSHASTIRDKKQRMAIDAAGVGMELIIAVAATYAWLLTDDGPLRSAFFMVSSTTWILSLLVNLNPLMKFDGYYLLSDHWNIPNLQSRAVALTQWKIRRFFLNWPGAKPEQFPPKLERKMQVYATLSLIYRLFIFMSIALGVYAFFFKALGLFLVLLNLVWLVLLPMGRELYIWWSVRKVPAVKTRKNMWIIGGLIVLTVLFYPTSTVINAPALLTAKEMTMFYSLDAAVFKGYNNEQGADLTKGQVIVELISPELEGNLAIEMSRQTEMERTLKASSVSPLLVQARKRVEAELRLSYERVSSVKDKIEKLTIRAPFAGRLVWLDDQVKLGDWIEEGAALAMVVAPSGLEVKAYIEESDWAQFSACKTTLFYPFDPKAEPIEVVLASQSVAGGNELKDPYFASIYGGEIAVRKDKDGRLFSDTAIQELHFEPLERLDQLSRPLRGSVRLCSAPKSIASGFVDAFYVLFVKEMGF